MEDAQCFVSETLLMKSYVFQVVVWNADQEERRPRWTEVEALIDGILWNEREENGREKPWEYNMCTYPRHTKTVNRNLDSRLVVRMPGAFKADGQE